MRTEQQIRADVERALHHAFGVVTALPMALVGRVVRCTAHTTSRLIDLVPPLRLLRSALDVTLANVVSPAESALSGAPGAVGGDAATTPAPPPAGPAAAADVAPAVVDAAVPAVGARDDEAAEDLPIAEYESLAASHVVARLDALTPDELLAVRDFETAHRGRRTVLGKIDQLLA